MGNAAQWAHDQIKEREWLAANEARKTLVAKLNEETATNRFLEVPNMLASLKEQIGNIPLTTSDRDDMMYEIRRLEWFMAGKW